MSEEKQALINTALKMAAIIKAAKTTKKTEEETEEEVIQGETE